MLCGFEVDVDVVDGKSELIIINLISRIHLRTGVIKCLTKYLKPYHTIHKMCKGER